MMAIRYWNKDTPFEVPDKPRPPTKPVRDFTPIQLETMRYWQSFIADSGHPPTIAEASRHFRITRKALQNRINGLVKKGGLSPAREQQTREALPPIAPERTPIIGLASTRPLYMQTAHGFVGSVTQERKCACGQSHFTDNVRCADCLRASPESVVT